MKFQLQVVALVLYLLATPILGAPVNSSTTAQIQAQAQAHAQAAAQAAAKAQAAAQAAAQAKSRNGILRDPNKLIGLKLNSKDLLNVALATSNTASGTTSTTAGNNPKVNDLINVNLGGNSGGSGTTGKGLGNIIKLGGRSA